MRLDDAYENIIFGQQYLPLTVIITIQTRNRKTTFIFRNQVDLCMHVVVYPDESAKTDFKIYIYIYICIYIYIICIYIYIYIYMYIIYIYIYIYI